MNKWLVLTGLLLTVPVSAQESHKVHFDLGTSSTVIDGTVTGEAFADYRLGAKAAQTMTVSMDIDSSGYLSVFGPTGLEDTVFDGSMDGSEFSGKLKSNGIYTIRVYQLGADADENVTGHFELVVAVH